MNNVELRAAALDEYHRRLKLPRRYDVGGGVSVSAATQGNALSLVDLRRAAEAVNLDGPLLPWLGEGLDLLTPMQARALCRVTDVHVADLYNTLGQILRMVDDGVITDKAALDNAVWPA